MDPLVDLRPCSSQNSDPKKAAFHFLILLRADAPPDTFQSAVIVFTIVLCHRRRRPH